MLPGHREQLVPVNNNGFIFHCHETLLLLTDVTLFDTLFVPSRVLLRCIRHVRLFNCFLPNITINKFPYNGPHTATLPSALLLQLLLVLLLLLLVGQNLADQSERHAKMYSLSLRLSVRLPVSVLMFRIGPAL